MYNGSVNNNRQLKEHRQLNVTNVREDNRGYRNRGHSVLRACACHYVPNRKLFIFKSCSLWIIAPILQEIYKRSNFSSSGLYCLEAGKQNKTKHYPGAVPSHLPKTNKCEFLTIKQTAYYVKNITAVHDYWYLIVATCFGLSLDHLQAYINK